MLIELNDSDPTLTIGELRGLLAALAWANGKPDHEYTFTLERLPDQPTLEESLHSHFKGQINGQLNRVAIDELADWHTPLRDALRLWLFQQFHDLVKSESFCSMIAEDDHREIVAKILRMIEGGVKPTRVVRVLVEPDGWYECAWDDFAILGEAGWFFLHLGVSD